MISIDCRALYLAFQTYREDTIRCFHEVKAEACGFHDYFFVRSLEKRLIFLLTFVYMWEEDHAALSVNLTVVWMLPVIFLGLVPVTLLGRQHNFSK